jgi:hypothetical protein
MSAESRRDVSTYIDCDVVKYLDMLLWCGDTHRRAPNASRLDQSQDHTNRIFSMSIEKSSRSFYPDSTQTEY